ncbi:1,3-beta-glucan synthase [Rhizoctonia solani]|uniref:1,3-beta-glucan synthase n=1 Tax=Rhizoctonia solani TaxID=456999 RepID=A0A0K6G8B5_9AGAM|nr:1,3-beta-glucan synthase [Rhizoctonia solani]
MTPMPRAETRTPSPSWNTRTRPSHTSHLMTRSSTDSGPHPRTCLPLPSTTMRPVILMSPTQPGVQTDRSTAHLSPGKSKISSSTSHKSLAFNATRCATRLVSITPFLPARLVGLAQEPRTGADHPAMRITLEALTPIIVNGYKVQDGKFVRREKDHEDIIGYDDVNQLFWYPEGIARIMLNDRTRLVDLPPAQRFMKFDKVDWSRAFFKSYNEKRTSLQLLVHFNRIWILHVSLFGIIPPTTRPSYIAGPRVGAVSTVIMIFATLAEFTFIPTTWNNTSHLSRRLIVLLIVLGLTTGPSFYVFIANDGSDGSSPALIISIVQFLIAVIATLLFSIVPSGRMFGDRVVARVPRWPNFYCLIPDHDP